MWEAIIASLAERFHPLVQEWKPSRSAFARTRGYACSSTGHARSSTCAGEQGAVVVAAVLGERAAALALESDLPEGIKTLLRQARPYAEGRGIRFPASSAADVSMVTRLVAIKTTPK